MDTLSTLVDATLAIEKVRVRTQIRQSHLTLDGRKDEETDNLMVKLLDLEGYVDGRIAKILTTHPAYPWFSQVKGIGKENIGKVVGMVRVAPEKGYRINEETEETQEYDMPFADSISALWKFSGYAPVEGHAEKRIKGGGTLHYNAQLRTMCWRLGSSLLRAKGKFYEYYNEQKERYVAKYEAAGVKIVPSTQLPKVDGKKQETDGFISEGHVHNQALRKMIKLFLACLWLTWRENANLPVSNPYPIDILGHSHFIDPWSMVDKIKVKVTE